MSEEKMSKNVDMHQFSASGIARGEPINDSEANQVSDDICDRLDQVFDLIFSSPLQKNPINFLEFSGISSGGNVVPSGSVKKIISEIDFSSKIIRIELHIALSIPVSSKLLSSYKPK